MASVLLCASVERCFVSRLRDIFCGAGGGFVFDGGALLIGGSSVCDDLGGISTGDEVVLTSPPELAHWGGGRR